MIVRPFSTDDARFRRSSRTISQPDVPFASPGRDRRSNWGRVPWTCRHASAFRPSDRHGPSSGRATAANGRARSLAGCFKPCDLPRPVVLYRVHSKRCTCPRICGDRTCRLAAHPRLHAAGRRAIICRLPVPASTNLREHRTPVGGRQKRHRSRSKSDIIARSEFRDETALSSGDAHRSNQSCGTTAQPRRLPRSLTTRPRTPRHKPEAPGREAAQHPRSRDQSRGTTAQPRRLPRSTTCPSAKLSPTGSGGRAPA